MRRATVYAAALLLAAVLIICPAWAASEIILGAPTSLTTLEGMESLMAVRMAVSEINRAGGVVVKGVSHRLRLEPYDLMDSAPDASPKQVVAKLDQFMSEKKPHAMVIGPFRSEVLLAAMDSLAKAKVPTLGAIAMSPAVDAKVMGDERYRYIFRVCLSTRYLAPYLMENMKVLKSRFGFSRVYILNQDVAWARSTASLMIRLYFEPAGWEVLGQKNLPGQSEDYEDVLAKVREKDAQVILAIFDSPASVNLVRQWRKAQVPAVLSGFISPISGPRAWQEFGGHIAGVMSVVFELGNAPSVKYPPARFFYQAFKERFDRNIQAGHGPAPAYESVYLLAEAITRAGSLDPDMIVAELEKTDRKGVMGRLRFHKGHQVIFGQNPAQAALACVVQWGKDGRRRIVLPRSIAEGEIMLPSFIEKSSGQ